MSDAKKIGKAIRTWREQLDLSRPDVSRALERQGVKLTPTYLEKLERGERNFGGSRLELKEALRGLYGVPHEEWTEATGIAVPPPYRNVQDKDSAVRRPDASAVGRALTQMRKAAGLTLAEAVERVNATGAELSRKTLAHLEEGRKELHTIYAGAQAALRETYGVDPRAWKDATGEYAHTLIDTALKHPDPSGARLAMAVPAEPPQRSRSPFTYDGPLYYGGAGNHIRGQGAPTHLEAHPAWLRPLDSERVFMLTIEPTSLATQPVHVRLALGSKVYFTPYDDDMELEDSEIVYVEIPDKSVRALIEVGQLSQPLFLSGTSADIEPVAVPDGSGAKIIAVHIGHTSSVQAPRAESLKRNPDGT